MLKGFQTILVKELKELIRDPKILLGMIIFPLITFPVLGAVLGYAQQTAQKQAQKATLLVVNNDNGNWSQTLIDFLTASGVKTTVVSNLTPEQVLEQDLLSTYNSTQFLVIPHPYSANLRPNTSGRKGMTAPVNVYGVFQGGG